MLNTLFMFSSNATLLLICGSSFLDGVIFLFFKLLLRILSMIGSSLGMLLKRKNTGSMLLLLRISFCGIGDTEIASTFNSHHLGNVNIDNDSFLIIFRVSFHNRTKRIILTDYLMYPFSSREMAMVLRNIRRVEHKGTQSNVPIRSQVSEAALYGQRSRSALSDATSAFFLWRPLCDILPL
ncbi:hypothetical protein Tco_0158607 [Tanacetum coccineum]